MTPTTLSHPLVLLQTRDVPLDKILLASLGLVALIVIGLVVVSHVRRRLNAADEPDASGGFMLSDLRRLHREGQMSDEEFEKAKARVVDAAKRAAARDAGQTQPKRDGPRPE